MNELGEMLFWAAILLAGLLAFQWWGNLPANRSGAQLWNQKAEETLEAAQFAAYRNRLTESALPQISGDYDDARAFALDYDVRSEEVA